MWDPRIQRGINSGFRIFYSTNIWLVMNIVIGSMPMKFHILSDDMLYTVASSTFEDTEVLIRIVISMNLMV